MLRELRVGNLALVEDLTLELTAGLTMLTGETGAGKSLIAGALSLLTGVKAERGLIRAGEELAWVEGVFDLTGRPRLLNLLAEMGVRVGSDQILVLRRELRREGRGRVLINGLVSSLALLAEIGPALLSIQSQDQQRQLARSSFAQEFLDDALGLAAERRLVQDRRLALQEASRELARRRQEAEFAQQQLEMWEYQQRELAGMGLDSGEESELAEQLAFGRHARSLLEAAGRARADLTEGTPNVQLLLGGVESALAGVAENSQRIAEVLSLVQDAAAAVSEAGSQLERFLDGAVLDPAKLDEMEERKAQYEDLRRKYDRDVPGLMALEADLAERIGRQKVAGRNIDALVAAVASAREELAAAAGDLRGKRVAGAARVAAEAADLIRPLALPELELEFEIKPRPAGAEGLEIAGVQSQVTAAGADVVRLLVRTNRGEDSGEVSTIASGGEKSRIYLGLSVVSGRGQEQPLLLFDEIDAGLGMDNAVPVARLLGTLAQGGQVLCITHLATVAARGDAHVLAAKEVVGERTVLSVKPLTEAQRLVEIARLLGGAASGEPAEAGSREAYARQLLARG